MSLLLIRANSVHSTPTHPISLRRISTLFSNLSSAVLIKTKTRAGRERIRVCFSPLQDQYLLWGISSLIFIGYRGLSSVVKWPGCGANHLPSSSTEVKNDWICNSSPPYAFVTCTATILPLLPISIHCGPKWRHMFRISRLRLYFFIYFVFYTRLYIPSTSRSLMSFSYLHFVKYNLRTSLKDFLSFLLCRLLRVLFYDYIIVKSKAVPLQTWSGPEGSRNLRFPDFMTTAEDGGKVVSLTNLPPLPPGNTPGTHFC